MADEYKCSKDLFFHIYTPFTGMGSSFRGLENIKPEFLITEG